MNNKKLSESVMAESFEKCLRRNFFNEFPKFNLVAKEIICQQGVADFITIVGSQLKQKQIEKINHVFNGSTEGYIKVFSLLRHFVPRTESYLIKKSGFSRKTVRSILKNLMDKKAIVGLSKGPFMLSPSWRLKSVELWAFELKINDWKRAIFQSLQYKAFADRVTIVFPVEREKILRENIEIFKKSKIGVMLFDAFNQHYKILLPPLKSKPSSRTHRLFAFSKITSSAITNKS